MRDLLNRQEQNCILRRNSIDNYNNGGMYNGRFGGLYDNQMVGSSLNQGRAFSPRYTYNRGGIY